MIYYDIPQNEDEWRARRGGKVTGSGATKIMANEGKAFGAPANAYAIQIAIERITGELQGGNGYSNAHMERGHEQEPLARKAYEDEYFCEVSNGGFFDCGNEGCSPDGLVYEDGVIEIKSVIPSVHYQNVKRANIDPTYKWQLYFNLQKTERKWIDFVSYCHEYPRGKKLFVHRLSKGQCQEVFERMDARVREFELLIEEVSGNIIRG
jgi:hypothetical protein